MPKTEDTIEYRLNFLESAVAALVATLAHRHDELARETANSLQQMAESLQQISERVLSQQSTLQAISEQQNLLETKFDQILIKQQIDDKSEPLLEKEATLPQVRQAYVNWKEKHDNLLQRVYVPYYDFFDTLEILNQYESAPRKLINIVQTTFRVNKTTRFPTNGWYVNINNPKIKHEIYEIIYAVLNERNISNYQSDIDKVLKILRSLTRGCGIYDVTSFEKITDLNWADVNNISPTAPEREEIKEDDQPVKEVEKQEMESIRAEKTLTDNHHGYINWDQTHDFLETHSYVGFRAVYDTIQFWKTSVPPGFPKQLNIACLQQKISNIFGPLFKVDKTKRFPSHGLYLNVNLQAIQSHLETLFVYRIDSNFNREQFDAGINMFFKAIDDIFVNNQEGLYNRNSFEEKYNLKWVENAE